MPRTARHGIEITGLTADSRAVGPGMLFAALPGSRADGRAFIADAVARGAAAVLAPRGTPDTLPDGRSVPLVEADEPRRALACMAARFHGRQPEAVAAVTGTNGKTSTVAFLRRLWWRLGHCAGSLGTLGLEAPGVAPQETLTTPDPIALHATLARLHDAGVDHLAMEASSHGLAQYRLDGVRVKAAAFTNLTRDHLDYHADMDAYRAAKGRLFADILAGDGTAVIDVDGPEAPGMIALCQARGLPVLTVGRGGRDVTLEAVQPLADGLRLTLAAGRARRTLTLPVAGLFQADNLACAVGLAIACGDAPEAVLEALEAVRPVPGRMERVATAPAGAPVLVDYAHTPAALEGVLAALRPHVAGRLAVVFGCGGDRDPGKRPGMGAIAARLADRVWVTDDNPRGEDPAAIRRAILDACPGAVEVDDRAAAITAAVAGLGPDDLLLIAGKGHERGQIVGKDVIPFDDAAAARRAVQDAAGGEP